MNIRFVNNLTQHVKSFYIVTKIKHFHLYQICAKFLLNKNSTKARNYQRPATIKTILTSGNPNNKTATAINIKNILKIITTTSSSSSIKNQYNKGEVLLYNNNCNKKYINNGYRFKELVANDFQEKSSLQLCVSETITKINHDHPTFLRLLTNLYTMNYDYLNNKHNENGNGARDENRSYDKESNSSRLFITAFTFSFLGWENEEGNDDDPSAKLIMQIKRSMLCIQREQFDKAEQMLHLALRMAQDLQSSEGITYIYDLMANLAMEREQYPKAEKLFADVMKRLFSEGHGEESPQILHISSKLAHMAQLQGDLEKAYQGFTWTLERIARSIQNTPEDKDLQELFGLTKNWFGQLLMKQGKYMEAKKHFEAAHQVLTDVYGNVNEAAVTILNNLSIACFNLDDYAGAKNYLNKAIDLVKELKDSTHEGILYANLGLIYLREGLTGKAKESCSLAYRIGKKQNNPDAIEQAEYCLSEVKSSL